MLACEVFALLQGTSDAAIAIAPDGRIRGCNEAAEALFGHTAKELESSYCTDLMGSDDSTDDATSCPDCAVLDRAMAGQPSSAFDCSIRTSDGPRWVNVSTITLAANESGILIVQLLRDVHTKKKLETLTRQMLDQIPGLPGETVEELLGSPQPHVDLTPRELSVLKLLANGRSTRVISTELGISLATVRNHINHILKRLGVHSRTEAVLRAVNERLI